MNVVVAEKPSVARDLGAFLGARTRHDGYLAGNGWTVTWALGHLAELKKPDEYDPALKRWSLESLPFVPARFELVPSRGDGGIRKQLEVVARLCRDAERLVCATDAGREGELIFRYLLEIAGCGEREFERLWLSSLTDAAIRAAFGALRPGSAWENLHAAARSRSEADWIVGINATRAYTVRFGGGRVLWSVGRVQTPVLALIARRDDEIRTFVVETFWELRTHYRDVRFRLRGERFKTREPAEALLALVTDRPFRIDSIDRKEERTPPPLLHDLTSLQRDMNLRFGTSAARTLEIAQGLYERKVITYPRTDSRHLTPDMHEGVQQTLRALRPWNQAAIDLVDIDNLPRHRRVFDAGKVADHHAIIPTGVDPRGLGGEDAQVFELVARRLVQAFLPDRVQAVTTVDASVVADLPHAPVPFRARGVRVLEAGWTALEPKDRKQQAKPGGAADGKRSAGKPGGGDDTSDDDTQVLPDFVIGESGPHRPELHEGSTKPPRPYTENTLLAAMETAGKLVDDESLREALKARGLGTPATRASILETLIQRRYVARDKKTLRVTDLGRYLIGVIQDPLLKSAELTGEWEQKLKRIEAGEFTRDEFMAEIRTHISQLVTHIAPPLPSGDAQSLGPCPRCGSPVVEGNRGYGCSAWREKQCGFVLWKEFRDAVLTPMQARELVARRILLRPVRIDGGSAERILCLTESGALIDLEPPSREAQERRARGANEQSSRNRSGRTSAPRSEAASEDRARPARPKSPPRPRAAAADAPGLPDCPLCHANLIEGQRGFGCTRWQAGCKFVVWKQIAGKRITAQTVRTLLEKGQTRLGPGFVDAAGAPCKGRLVLQDGRVEFVAEASS